MSYLTISGLNKSYGDIRALDSFSLSVTKGEIFALVGPDGAGKTTMIRILCRLLTPDSGTVTIDGRDTFSSYEEIKPLLGYMPQQFSLYPDLTVEENLRFYAGIYGYSGRDYERKRALLYRFSNLAPFSTRRASALSGGMKQKLALSCALMHDPQLLVLDEPTTGVDPLSRRQFWEMLLQLRNQGVTILISTPYMDEVARGDRACFIFSGRKLSEGTPRQLAEQFEGKVFRLDQEPTSDLVERLNNIGGLSARRFGAGLHLYIDAGDSIEQYAGPLRTLGFGADDFIPLHPSLEDRFIQLMETQP